jgi:ribosomal protein L7/L12
MSMLTPTHALVFALGIGLFACDDTGKALKEEVKEVDKQKVKQDLKEAGRKVEEGAKQAVDETGKVIDKVDKKVAEEIRKD